MCIIIVITAAGTLAANVTNMIPIVIYGTLGAGVVTYVTDVIVIGVCAKGHSGLTNVAFVVVIKVGALIYIAVLLIVLITDIIAACQCKQSKSKC